MQKENKRKINKQNKQSGAAMLISVIFFLFISLAIITGLVSPTVRGFKNVSANLNSKQSYFLAESGGEDVVYRLKNGMSVSDTEVLNLDNTTITTITTNIPKGKQIVATADNNNHIRKTQIDVALGSGVAFFFGVQSGEGGLLMENSSSVSGNVYSNGSVAGSGSGNNVIGGSVVSAGPSGSITNLHSTGSAYAHTIQNAKIDGDAYYQTISDTTVLGTSYPDSPDQPAVPLPISDEQIEEWKQVALEGGGTISSPCPYKITGTSTLGPVKIACDLEISGTNYTITLMGNVWVEGDIIVSNSPTLKVDSTLGAKGVVLIADKPSNQTTSSKISLNNSAVFEGSGSPGSHVMFVSQNRSAELGGSKLAIDVSNTISGALLVYAGHGEILLQNSIDLKEISAYKIRLKNTAEVVYDSGIANLLFDSGPSGGYEIFGWKETK